MSLPSTSESSKGNTAQRTLNSMNHVDRASLLDGRLALWDLGFPYTSVRLFMRGPNARIRHATTIQHAAMYANTLR